MTYFTRGITSTTRQLTTLNIAYQAAGLDIPTHGALAHEAIADEPGVEQVRAQLAAESLTTDDPKKWLTGALDRLARAHAADLLRQTVAGALNDATQARMPEYLTRAATDLAPAFNAVVKTLTAAAKKLPDTDPLSEEAAIVGDHTAALKAARQALTSLTPYAALHVSGGYKDAPGVLVGVLGILDIGDVPVERVAKSWEAGTRSLMAPDEYAHIHAVRDLAAHLRDDPDTALIDVARGRYKGVTFSLADPVAFHARRASANRAFQRVAVNEVELRNQGRDAA